MMDLTGCRGLSLWEPWATLWAHGEKLFETRSWVTNYIGPLLICATKKVTEENLELCQDEPFRGALRRIAAARGLGSAPKLGDVLSPGCAIGVGYLDHCWPTESSCVQRELAQLAPERHFGNFTPGRTAWLLRRDITVFPNPIPVRGAQGLWLVPPDVIEQVQSTISRAA